jgi:hypothetical protein
MTGYIIMLALMALAVSVVSMARRRKIRRDAGFPLSSRRESALRFWCGL